MERNEKEAIHCWEGGNIRKGIAMAEKMLSDSLSLLDQSSVTSIKPKFMAEFINRHASTCKMGS